MKNKRFYKKGNRIRIIKCRRNGNIIVAMIENEEIKKEEKRGVMKKKRKSKSINRIKRYIY